MAENKKNLIRIIITAILFVITIHIYYFVDMPLWGHLIMFLAVYLVIGYDILWRAVRNISHGQVFDENLLMVIATIGAFAVGEYPEAVAVMLFYQVGELFQSYAVGKSRKSIASLMDIRPDFARVLENGKEMIVAPEFVQVGNTIVVKPGERVPLDGVIISGVSSLDTSALTGESVPHYCQAGDSVVSGSINTSGVLTLRVEKAFYDSTVSKILDLVENASAKKAKAENFITKFASYYTPAVVILAVLLAVIPPLFDGNWTQWVHRALTFLVVSCPCALVISVPLSFFGGIGGASKQGILIKGGNYMELLDKANIFVFDKTGTLTKGEFAVQEVVPSERREEILNLASIAESGSLHPIAKSILREKQAINTGYKITETAGKGVVAVKDSDTILVGNSAMMKQYNIAYALNDSVGSIVYVAKNNEFIGSIVISDGIKDDSVEAIEELHKKSFTTVMLTGDNKTMAKYVADKVRIDEYHAELLPIDKVNELEKILAKKGKKDTVAFIGDGINDAPVLMRADIGIAMGGVGSDSAIEAADIVLMHDKLSSIPLAKRIAHKTMRIVKQNIIFALSVKIAVLALSAIGIANMWMAVFADVGVAVLAILNAMRAGKKHK